MTHTYIQLSWEMLSLPFGTQINNIIIITINTLQRAVHFVYLIIVALCLFLATPCSQFLFSIFSQRFFLSKYYYSHCVCVSNWQRRHRLLSLAVCLLVFKLEIEKFYWHPTNVFENMHLHTKKGTNSVGIFYCKKYCVLKNQFFKRVIKCTTTVVLWSVNQVFKWKLPDLNLLIVWR